MNIQEIEVEGFEKVLEVKDEKAKLHCFIALHDTRLGPTLGGCRIHPYNTREEALEDVLRLSRGMTYKSALAQCELGGGKSVIIADPGKDKTPELLHAYGQAVDTLNGMYITAEDIGCTLEDMAVIKEATPYVSCLATDYSTGDPSRFTARGTYLGMKAVAKKLWNKDSLRDVRIAIQGLGNVGSKLTDILFWEGADLVLCDVDKEKAKFLAHFYRAESIDSERYTSIDCDILAPCAMGGIINQETIPHLKCQAVAGGANNQLGEDEDGTRLFERDILYAPDYVINAGGLINAIAEFDIGGYNPKRVRDKVEHIYNVLLKIFHQSEVKNMPTNVIADEIALYNIEHGIGKREEPIDFH